MNALLVYILLLGISNRYTIIYNVVLFRSLAGMTSHVPHLNTLPTVNISIVVLNNRSRKEKTLL
jgi:hypothetical protein